MPKLRAARIKRSTVIKHSCNMPHIQQLLNDSSGFHAIIQRPVQSLVIDGLPGVWGEESTSW